MGVATDVRTDSVIGGMGLRRLVLAALAVLVLLGPLLLGLLPLGLLPLGLLPLGLPTAAPAATTPTTVRTPVALDPKIIVSIVKVAAYASAVRVAASVGTPSCPAAIKAAVGLTFQCLVPFDKTPVAFLVTIGDAGALDARPTFPVVSLVAARVLAGFGSSCGAAKATFVVLPIGATLACTVGTGTGSASGTTVTLRVADQYGTLIRISTR